MPFVIEKYRLYCNSIHCSGNGVSGYYFSSFLSLANFVYPINVGNISITGSRFRKTNSQNYLAAQQQLDFTAIKILDFNKRNSF